jgi:hypothetical protein
VGRGDSSFGPGSADARLVPRRRYAGAQCIGTPDLDSLQRALIRKDAIAYLAALGQIKQEALCAGRQETYTLLRDRDAWWQEQPGTAFDPWQSSVGRPACAEAAVERLVLGGDGICMIWRVPTTEQGEEDDRFLACTSNSAWWQQWRGVRQ